MLTPEQIRSIIKSKKGVINTEWILEQDAKWEEIQRIFKNCNDDLSRIPIVPEHVEYNKARL